MGFSRLRTCKSNYFLAASLLFLLVATMAGCGLNDRKRAAFDSHVSASGVGSLVAPDFEEVDLVCLLDPDNCKGADYQKGRDEMEEKEKIIKAFRAFRDKYPIATRVMRRNAVQEHIIAASNQRCNYYKNYLHCSRATTNLALGSLATIAGTAGAIVTGADAPRILSGAAAVFSGVRAEFNQEYFANAATDVVAKGIDLTRREVYHQIVTQGQSKSYGDYNVEAAVKDAIYYHGQCNVMTGIQAASGTLEMMEDPGIDTVNRILVKLNLTKKLRNDATLTPEKQARMLSRTNTLLKAGTPKDSKKSPGTLPVQVLTSALNRVKTLVKDTKMHISKLSAREDSTKKKLEELQKEIDGSLNTAEKKLNQCNTQAAEASKTVLAREIDHDIANLDNSSKQKIVNAKYNLIEARAAADAISTKINTYVSQFDTHLTEIRNRLPLNPDKFYSKEDIHEAVEILDKNEVDAPCRLPE